MLDVSIQRQLGSFRLAVDLSVGAETLVLFGPSGAGKTMTLKLIAGLERPDIGRITLNGRTLFDSRAGIDIRPQERSVGYIPQTAGLFPHLTALENVALPLRKGRSRLSAGEARKRAFQLLESLGLADRAEAKPGELSGGQRQRVAFARILATEPEVLLLDEPFAALDARVRTELRQEFRRFQRSLGVPAIFITHDLEEATLLGDRLAIIIDGQIRQIGPTRHILDHPADREVALLVQSGNLLEGEIQHMPERQVVITAAGPIEVDANGYKDRQAVTAVIRPNVIRIVRPDRDASRLAGSTIVEGTITDIADFGSHMAVTTRVCDTSLQIDLSPTAAANLDLRVGNPVRLAIPKERVHLIGEGKILTP